MVPAVRALADRFIYDTSMLKYIAANAPDGGPDRPTLGSGWTVRQVLAHLAENQQRYADTVARWLGGEPGFQLPGDPTEANADAARRNVTKPLADVVAQFDRSIRELPAAIGGIDEKRLSGSMGSWPAMRVLTAWSAHAQSHAIDLVSALPELKRDPMVVGWALHFDFSTQPKNAQWQQELARDVRAMFQPQGKEE